MQGVRNIFIYQHLSADVLKQLKISGSAVFILLTILQCSVSETKMVTYGKEVMDYSAEQLEDLPQMNIDDLTLKRVGVCKIPIDNMTLNPIIYPTYYDDGKEHFFVHFNEAIKALDIYNLNTKNLIKRIQYPIDGPLTISSKSRPFVKSMDSIFLFTPFEPAMILLIDSSGRQKDVFSILPNNLPARGDVLPYMVSQFGVIMNKIVLPFRRPYYEVQLRDSANFLILNLKDMRIIESRARRPFAYTAGALPGNHDAPRICLGHSYSVVTYSSHGPLIVRQDLISDSLYFYILRSKYIDRRNLKSRQSKYNYPHLEKDNYHMMTYDPYRNYYYLMCLLKEEPFDDDGNLKDVSEKQISIIIADTLFRYRGEVLLPRDKYFRSMMVTRDGLLVSTAHPKNKQYYTDTLSYAVFKVVPTN